MLISLITQCNGFQTMGGLREREWISDIMESSGSDIGWTANWALIIDSHKEGK